MRRHRSGAQAVEFALSLPVLIVILSGVIDYSYYFHLQYNMINAVAQGVRSGIEVDVATAVGDPDPLDVAEDVAEEVWFRAEVTGTATFTAAYGTLPEPDRTLVLTGSMPYQRLVGFVPAPPTVTHTATMRMIDQTDPDPATTP